jgi:serine/threonine protein kinase
LEKYDEHFYLVRDGIISTGLEPFQIVDPEQKVAVLLKIIEILRCYHQQGLLSGGLSLGQLKLDQEGSFYLQDPITINFLSKSLSEEYKVDSPPEVVRGKSWDQRSEVFSWGVLAYRLLTGQDPFLAPTSAERLEKILKIGALSPRDVNPELSDGLSRLIIDSLNSEPLKRPSLDELYKKLAHLLEQREIIVGENELRHYREKAQVNRNLYQAKEKFRLWFRKFGIATLVSVAALALVFFTWMSSQSKPVITVKNKPSEVLAYYFKGIQTLDVTLIDETLQKEDHSFSGMITNLYVINKTQQGMTYSTKDNAKLDLLNLVIKPLSQNSKQAKYKAGYTIRINLAKETQCIEREDIFVLKPVRKVWRITGIKVLKEKRWKEEHKN